MEERYEALKSLCETRSSCREFTEDPVADNLIEKIQSIARTSPYAGGRKNWEIVTIAEIQTKELLARCIEAEVDALSRLMDSETFNLFKRYSRNFTFFTKAPVILVPVFRISPVIQSILRENISKQQLMWERDNSVKSISCVSMLILLAAESIGLGACYMTGPLIAQEGMSKILNLPPERQIGALIPVGYPANTKNK